MAFDEQAPDRWSTAMAPAQPDIGTGRKTTSLPYHASLNKSPMQPIPETSSSNQTAPNSRGHLSSYAEDNMSFDTLASSLSTLPALQTTGTEGFDQLEPLLEDDPRSFDLIETGEQIPPSVYALEARAEQIFSKKHLKYIFSDSSWLLKFTSFLSANRPESVPVLVYYLDALKALRAIRYANAIAEALGPLEDHAFTKQIVPTTQNRILEAKAEAAFTVLAQEYLPAYVTDVFIRVVSLSIQRRVTGTLPQHLREASEGLAEVFCLTDPSRADNPIVFASEEFHRTTQYGVNYAIGRNCRFLQGPRTNKLSVQRISKACKDGKDHCETFVNYRRDGSPFMNLLMVAPLRDSRGVLRYFIGAQVDISGLVKECTDLDALQQMLADESDGTLGPDETKKDEFQALTEMYNIAELETVRKHGGNMHREHIEDADDTNSILQRPRLLLKDSSPNQSNGIHTRRTKINGKLSGVYSHYLLIRPYPSLRILFTSPSLRLPGILQSPFMDRIGSSNRVREELISALAEGRGVTAKVRWLTRTGDEGRTRWIHCTPLLNQSGTVGVWMVVLVHDDTSQGTRKFREAPPVSSQVGQDRNSSPYHRTGSMLSDVSQHGTIGSGQKLYGSEPQLSVEDLTFDV